MKISPTFFITFILLSIGMIGISIKIWGKKGGRFSGTCASQNPLLNPEQETCSLCGKKPEESICNKATETK